MSIQLNGRQDFTLDNFFSVAWQGQSIELSSATQQLIDRHRDSFLKLIDSDQNITVYGVTSGYGQMASLRLDATQRAAHAKQPPYACAVGFGGELPERIKRGIVFCRLSNFIEGNAAVSSELAVKVANLLHGDLPAVAAIGNASAGEIVPLSALFSEIWENHTLKEKEALALINGSPCASALMADIALSAQQRISLCLDIFALAAAAIGSPAEHYSDALESLYNDPAQTDILRQLRTLIGDIKNPRPYQAPVSWRIVPRILGQLRTALTQLEQCSAIALQSVTDNPAYIPPDQKHPLGQVLSNGGYHNANACPLMDQISGCYADLALLCDRQVSKLFDQKVSLLPHQLKAGDGHASCLGFIAADYAEQARHHAQRTGLIGSEGGGYGQNDVLQPAFQAWHKAQQAGTCLDATLAILAVTCSQAFYATDAVLCPPALRPLLTDIRHFVSPVSDDRALGQSVGQLAETFTQRIYQDCRVDTGH